MKKKISRCEKIVIDSFNEYVEDMHGLNAEKGSLSFDSFLEMLSHIQEDDLVVNHVNVQFDVKNYRGKYYCFPVQQVGCGLLIYVPSTGNSAQEAINNFTFGNSGWFGEFDLDSVFDIGKKEAIIRYYNL